MLSLVPFPEQPAISRERGDHCCGGEFLIQAHHRLPRIVEISKNINLNSAQLSKSAAAMGVGHCSRLPVRLATPRSSAKFRRRLKSEVEYPFARFLASTSVVQYGLSLKGAP